MPSAIKINQNKYQRLSPKNLVGSHLHVLSHVLNDSKDALIVSDEHGKIILANHYASSLFGQEPSKLVGENIKTIMPAHHRAGHDAYVAEYRKTNKGKILGVGPRRLSAQHADGTTIPIQLSISEITLGGERFFVAVCRDDSDRANNEADLRESNWKLSNSLDQLQLAKDLLEVDQKKLAELNQNLVVAIDQANTANRAKTDFLAVMSHELRTPLNGIIGMAQVLAATQLEQNQLEYLNVITESGQTLLTLLNDVLDLAKLQAGQLTLDPSPIELLPFVEKIVSYWNAISEQKEVKVKLTLIGEIPKVFRFDQTRVKQLLDNLLSNAVKFTETGEVTLEVKCEGSNSAAVLCLDVIDTGIGIDAAYHEEMFSPFTQADTSISRRFGGTGLGLAICKKLISQMDGTIGVQSAIGKGTRFTVRIPCQIIAGHIPAHAEIKFSDLNSRVRNSNKQIKILVAEDNLLNQQLITVILRTLNYQFTIVPNGVEAINQLESGQFDLVIMDMHMPKMDGLAATRAIRSRADNMRDIPILGLTASAFDADRIRCADAGMSAYLSKPYDIKILGAIIAQLTQPNTEQHQVASQVGSPVYVQLDC